MDGKLFLDTTLLRQHVTLIKREQRCARMLYDHLEAVKNLTGEETWEDYRRLLKDTQCLVDYFQAMANVMDNVCSSAEQTILKIGRMLQDMADSHPIYTIFYPT